MPRRSAATSASKSREPPVLRSGALVQACNTWKPIKSCVETEDPLDAMLLHNGKMQGIPRRQSRRPQYDRLGALDRRQIDRKHLIDDSKHGIERRLDGLAAVDGDISMQNLLQYFYVRHQ